MEMQQIRYFLTLAETLNFTRAAETCNVSQPALTRAIQALEAELGGELIRREGRLSHLTELGKRMLPLMERCYESARTAKDIARAVTNNDVAPLALAVSNSVNLECFLPAVSELFCGFPGIQLRITHGAGDDVMARLKAGSAEIALTGPIDSGWDRIDRWPLYEEGFELALHVDHPLAMDNMIDLEKLEGQAIFAQGGADGRDLVNAWFDERGVAYIVAHEIDSFHDLNRLLETGRGVALVPMSAPQASGIKRIRLNGFTVQRAVYASAVAGRPRTSSVSTFLNLLRTADYAGERAA